MPLKSKSNILPEDYQNLFKDKNASSKKSQISKGSKIYKEDVLSKKDIIKQFPYDCTNLNLVRRLSAEMVLDSNVNIRSEINTKSSKTNVIPMKINKQKINDAFKLIDSSSEDEKDPDDKKEKKVQEERRTSILSKLEDNLLKKFTEED